VGDEVESLKAEMASLRQQVEAYRQRELSDLKEQLARAKADASHYRSEAERNASIGRQIHLEAQQEIQRLRDKLNTKEAVPNARPVQPAQQRG